MDAAGYSRCTPLALPAERAATHRSHRRRRSFQYGLDDEPGDAAHVLFAGLADAAEAGCGADGADRKGSAKAARPRHRGG